MNKKFLFVTLGGVLNSIVGLLIQVLLGRSLSVHEYGQVTSLTAILNFCFPLIAFGCQTYLLSLFSEEGDKGVRWLPVIKKFFLCNAFFIFVFLNFYLVFFDFSNYLLNQYIIFFGGIFYSLTAFLSIKLQLEGKFFEFSIINYFPNFLKLFFLVLFFYFFDFSEDNGFFWIFIYIGNVFLFFYLYNIYSDINNKLNIGYEGQVGKKTPALKNLWSGTLPFGFSTLLHMLYFQAGIIILGLLSNPKEVARYNIAFILLNSVYIIPNIIYNNFLAPKIHRNSFKVGGFFYTVRDGLKYMIPLSLISIAFAFFLGNYGVSIVFGDKYNDSLMIFNIILLAIPFRYISIVLGAALGVSKHIDKKNSGLIFVCVFSIVSSFVFFPKNGALAAAYVYLSSEVILVIFYIILYKNIKDSDGYEKS